MIELILKIVLATDLFILTIALANYFSIIFPDPRIKMIEGIDEMDIPIGKKIDLMNRL